MKASDTLKLENQICFPLYAASREVVKNYYPLLSRIDLTYPQYITMMVMWEEEEISVKDLGRRLFLDSGTLTPLVKNLEKKGLVVKERSASDERVVNVKITKEGKALKAKAKDIPAKAASGFDLDEKDAIKLYEILYKILNAKCTNGE